MKLLLKYSEQTASNFHLRYKFYHQKLISWICKYPVAESQIASQLASKEWLQTSRNRLLGSDKPVRQTSPT